MKNFIYIVLALASLISCNNDDDNNHMYEILGAYSGTFKVFYEGDTITNPVTVIFYKNGEYESTSSVDKIPAGGSGTFTYDDSKITFEDENIWTADFDWNLILSGEYEYELQTNNYHLTFFANKNNIGYYEYDLWRPIPID